MEEKFSLTLFEKLRLLDKYMPLHCQIFAVLINCFFVLYEGWSSAALAPFACQVRSCNREALGGGQGACTAS
eukprot:351937-Chlamydomonas_euryale.AAC.13